MIFHLNLETVSALIYLIIIQLMIEIFYIIHNVVEFKLLNAQRE